MDHEEALRLLKFWIPPLNQENRPNVYLKFDHRTNTIWSGPEDISSIIQAFLELDEEKYDQIGMQGCIDLLVNNHEIGYAIGHYH